MEPIAATDPLSHSADLTAENIERLRELFPQAVTEDGGGKRIDFDVLRELLGGELATGEEKYGLNWHGKRAARRLALTPSTGTLRPAPEDSVDWDTTQNLMIEGDNLEVLKLLQKSYAGKVKMIYIDPPYNTGSDFVYKDDFRDSIGNYQRITGQRNEEGAKLTSNAESSGRFHTDWLNMVYPRLTLAKTLLSNDGIFFASCDDNEVSAFRVLLDEVFGADNFIAELIWKKSYGGGSKTKHVVISHEYVLCYARNKMAIGRLDLPPDPAAIRYYKSKDEKFDLRGPYRLQPLATTSNDERENLRYPIPYPYQGSAIWPEKQWQWERGRVLRALANNDLSIVQNGEEWTVNYKQYLRDENGIERGAKPFSVINGPYTQEGTAELAELFPDGSPFTFPKPTGLLQQLLGYLHPSKDFLALDFFAGSGGFGHAIYQQNALDGGTRRVILVQLPEATGEADRPAISDITKERLRRVAANI